VVDQDGAVRLAHLEAAVPVDEALPLAARVLGVQPEDRVERAA
jgi:hypothetical protein